MKSILLILSIFCLYSCFFAQKKNASSMYKKVYKEAIKYNDFNSASSACLFLIAEGNSNYKDTLNSLYTKNRKYLSSYLLTSDLLKEKPNDISLLETQVMNLKGLKMNNEALILLDTLLNKDKNNTDYLYERVLLLFQNKKLAEALETVNLVISNPINTDRKIKALDIKNQTINIPINALFYNLKGLIYYNLKDDLAAIESFKKSKELAPEYKEVNSNIISFEKKRMQKNKNQ